MLNKLRLDPKLNLNHVNHVVSIVSASRSGSSIVKWCLGQHPSLSSLAGEEEPYHKLAGNGWPWHQSDAYQEANNPEQISLLIANEIHNHETLHNRECLQRNMVEEPPFVKYKTCRKTEILLLKTPQNIYRRGVMEQLFPDRKITYFHLTRGFAQTVNGLVDGWNSNVFKARNVNGRWWKFDMPPNWSFCSEIPERAFNQWQMSHIFGLREYAGSVKIKFENFLDNKQEFCNRAWRHIGLKPIQLPTSLPNVMATKPPRLLRWKARSSMINRFEERAEEVMRKLGYSMNPSDWI